MATFEALNQKLSDMIESMEQDGLVDYHFKLVYSLKEEHGPFYFLDLVPVYCSDGQVTLAEMTRNLEQPVIDYHQLDELSLKLKGGSSCLGAHRVARACGSFRQAAAAECKDRCISVLNDIKLEFFTLKEKLDELIEIERKIVVGAKKD